MRVRCMLPSVFELASRLFDTRLESATEICRQCILATALVASVGITIHHVKLWHQIYNPVALSAKR